MGNGWLDSFIADPACLCAHLASVKPSFGFRFGQVDGSGIPEHLVLLCSEPRAFVHEPESDAVALVLRLQMPHGLRLRRFHLYEVFVEVVIEEVVDEHFLIL